MQTCLVCTFDDNLSSFFMCNKFSFPPTCLCWACVLFTLPVDFGIQAHFTILTHAWHPCHNIVSNFTERKRYKLLMWLLYEQVIMLLPIQEGLG